RISDHPHRQLASTSSFPGATKKKMSYENHQPHEQPAKQRDPKQVNESARRVKNRDNRGDDQARRRQQQGRQRNSFPRNPAQASRRVSAARKRKNHSRGEVEVAVHAGKSRRDNHEIHHVSGRGYVHQSEDADERTGGDVSAWLNVHPGHHSYKNNHGTEIEKYQPEHHPTHRFRHCFVWRLRFTSRDRNDFRADVADNHETHGHPNASPTMSEESAASSEVPQTRARRGRHKPEQNNDAKPNEGKNRNNLDHREPIFELAKIPDAARIDDDQQQRKQDDPYPRCNLWKPP